MLTTINKLLEKDIKGNTNVSIGYDTLGRMVCRTIGPVKNRDAVKHPFENCDFIALSKEDAENILDMLNSAISRLESGTRNDNDNEVFGDKAISYERLIDALDHTIYDLSELEKKELIKSNE